jgi:hypothetical protein
MSFGKDIGVLFTVSFLKDVSLVFSSPELKAQVSFSDRPLSVRL